MNPRSRGDDFLTQSAIVAREFAGWTGTIELDAADTADFIFRHVPAPGGDGVPGLDGDLHGVRGSMKNSLEGFQAGTSASKRGCIDVRKRSSRRRGLVNIAMVRASSDRCRMHFVQKSLPHSIQQFGSSIAHTHARAASFRRLNTLCRTPYRIMTNP